MCRKGDAEMIESEKRDPKEGLDRSKTSLLFIYKILKKESDHDHPLTQQEIIDMLAERYQITLERKAIGRNLGYLEEAGIEVGHAKKGCWLEKRDFEDAELRLLIDSVLGNKGVSVAQSKKLIEKLTDQANIYFPANVKHINMADKFDKTVNEALFYNIEQIQTAIQKKKQISYDYNKYGKDKKLHKTSYQVVTPLQLIMHNQKYYLVAYSEYWENVVHHRMDHISNLQITDKKAFNIKTLKGYENGIDYKKYATQLPFMYGDDPVTVDFLADEAVLDQVVEQFGKDAMILDAGNGRVKVHVKVSPMAMKYYALSYLDHLEVLKPESLRKEIQKSVKEAAKRYK